MTRCATLYFTWSVDLIVLQLDADNNMLDVTFISSSSLSNHPTLHSLNIRASKFGPLLKFSTGGSYLRQDPGQASDWSTMAGLLLANMRHQCFLGRNVDKFVTGIYLMGPVFRANKTLLPINILLCLWPSSLKL